ncbi:hypothetical protein, partial [Clostridium neonatale]
MECDRNQLKEILGVSLNALKLIEKRNNLEHRLNKVGYTLIDKYKKKNKYIYVIQKTNKKLKQKISNMYNTNRADKFISYFNIRTIERPMTIQEIAIRLGVSEKTIIKWDNTLQDKRILSKDGFYYFKLDRSNNEIIEISKEEYKTFWKNKSYL